MIPSKMPLPWEKTDSVNRLLSIHAIGVGLWKTTFQILTSFSFKGRLNSLWKLRRKEICPLVL